MHYVIKHFTMQFQNTSSTEDTLHLPDHKGHRKWRESTSESRQPRRAGVSELLAQRHNRLPPTS
jgi:hypothetical protein